VHFSTAGPHRLLALPHRILDQFKKPPEILGQAERAAQQRLVSLAQA